MDINGFSIYDVHILIPQNTESGGPELNNVWEKSQDNNKLILHNTIINAIWNQIMDRIQGFFSSSVTVRQVHVDEFQPSPILGINHITVPVKKGGRLDGWLIAEGGSCNNSSIAYFNNIFDNSILNSEGNLCDVISIPIIEITFDNDYIHVLNYLPKQ